MNEVLKTIYYRKSVRVFEEKDIPDSEKKQIIKAAMRAPTAGNMMLYTIIDVQDQKIKDALVHTCDNQPFIARSPLVLLFLADYQRWYDYFIASKVPEMCMKSGVEMRKPQEGNLFLSCCDALIAAQNAVIAGESLGIGSCYIGDIMENYEQHKKMFNLPEYVFPIALLCFGYPTDQQKNRQNPGRFDKEYIVFKDAYKRLSPNEFSDMYKETEMRVTSNTGVFKETENYGQYFYLRKFASDFSVEMTRSVKEILKYWK